ncbi:MAG TPA: hypothetical protein VN684_05870, partial [Terriglobales bacterium]|nr:hypothetical protein [Terriglobales bacterium]
MKIKEKVSGAMRRIAGVSLSAGNIEQKRRTLALPNILTTYGPRPGGAAVPADVRVVLEAHEIDPANPASLIAASTVLYDGVLTNAPEFATYVLVNAVSMNCDIAFTRMVQAPGTQVRSALPGQPFRTRLVGAQSDGAECTIVSGSALD